MSTIKILAISAACLFGITSCSTQTIAASGNTSSNTNSQTTSSGSSNPLGGLGSLGDLAGLGGVVDIISNTLGITTTDIVGTWVYEEPAVLFESDNYLSKAGGKVAAQSIAAKLDSYFQKVGISKGKMTMTFDKEGNFTQTIGKKSQQGTYTLENGEVKLKYKSGASQIIGTTQFDGNNLVIVVDVSKLMNFAQTIASAAPSSTLNSMSQLVSGFSGMKAGLEFKKQK